MGSYSLFLAAPPAAAFESPPPPHSKLLPSRLSTRRLHFTFISAVKSPKGFGPPPPPQKRKPKQQKQKYDDADDDDENEGEEFGDEAIPEVVTNRMMRRVGVSVGVPLGVGLLFFPFFYYLKVVAKVDVPTWIPFLVSFFFFGTALLGISYGIVSSSWDPLRAGSLLGWNEARQNWPVFWESLRGGGNKSGSRRGRR